jgi:hypothetical protein
MADDAKRSTFRIVHAHAAAAEKLANYLAEDFVLSNINFYVLAGEEKVAMLFVRKAPVASGMPRGAIIGR